MASNEQIGSWYVDASGDARMASGHEPYWRRLVDLALEKDLSGRSVFDFGCNQGGFLRLLHDLRPFERGVGFDIAADAVAEANRLKGDRPLGYETVETLSRRDGQFDLGFSYEVVYLLPDLARHAREIDGLLRPGGVYYAVTGCHTGNPLWPRMREVIAQSTNTVPQNYALDDILAAFEDEGFAVSARKFGGENFIEVQRDDPYFPSVADAIQYYSEAKVLFRMTKRR